MFVSTLSLNYSSEGGWVFPENIFKQYITSRYFQADVFVLKVSGPDSTYLAFWGPTDLASYDELAVMAWSGILPSSIPRAERHSPATNSPHVFHNNNWRQIYSTWKFFKCAEIWVVTFRVLSCDFIWLFCVALGIALQKTLQLPRTVKKNIFFNCCSKLYTNIFLNIFRCLYVG